METIVMGDGGKQLHPTYIFSLEPSGFANRSHMECKRGKNSKIFEIKH